MNWVQTANIVTVNLELDDIVNETIRRGRGAVLELRQPTVNLDDSNACCAIHTTRSGIPDGTNRGKSERTARKKTADHKQIEIKIGIETKSNLE